MKNVLYNNHELRKVKKYEEERIAAFNEIADIVIKYGIDELNKRSLPIDNYYPKKNYSIKCGKFFL